MTLTDLKSYTIKEYEKMTTKASNGSIVKDLMPIVRRCQIISILTKESVSPSYEKMIINYFMLNENYKK